jgi:L-lactate dehydrogenase complex protein LldG
MEEDGETLKPKETSSRSEVLKKIKVALSHQPPGSQEESSTTTIEAAHPAFSDSADNELQTRFQLELEAVGGECFLAANEEEASHHLLRLLQEDLQGRVVISREEIVRSFPWMDQIRPLLVDIHLAIDPMQILGRSCVDERIEYAGWAITGADFLIAATGSVALLSSPHRSRQISLLPTVHLVLAKPSQILPDLSALLNRLHLSGQPDWLTQSLTLVTGPSRTADIEKTLVKGVHGPERLIVLLLNWL